MKKLLRLGALLLGLLPSLAFAQYAALPTTGTLSGLQAVTDINTNFAAVFAAAPCGDSTHALGATTTSFTCQTLSGGGGSLALAASTSNVTYSALMAATTTSASLSTIYSGASYTYNPSTGIFDIASGGKYEIGGTQIALSNLTNGTTGTGTTVVLSAAPTISGSLTLSSLTTGIAETNGSGVVTSQAYGTSGLYLQSLGTSTTWAAPSGSGTVTTVSVATANGFSGTVANASSTPAITIIAGAINPTSIGATTSGAGTFSSLTVGSCSGCGSSGAAVANTTSNLTYYLGFTTSTTEASLATLYGVSTLTINPSTGNFSLPSGGLYEVAGTQIAASNLSNGTSGTGAVALVASPTFTGTVGAAALTASGIITGNFLISPPDALTISTATFTPTAEGSNDYRVVLVHASCPCTIANPSGTLTDGGKFTLEVWQSSTGSDTVGTWGSDYDFGTAGAPTLSTGINKGDVLGFMYSAQNSKLLYLGIQQGM